MPIYDIFSKRQKRLRGELPDVYQYETIPDELRTQVIHIWRDAFGAPYRGNQYPRGSLEAAYEFIHETLCREYGLFRLSKDDDPDDDFGFTAVCNFFLATQDTEKVIDVIEVSFQYMDRYDSNIRPEEAIAELNHRFQEHGVGYQFESGQIIRIDSQWIHSEVVKPALSMLSDPMYEGANDEFLTAHEHYRKGRYKACMNECYKAFESCIKAICDTRGWHYGNRGGIHLIKIVFNEGLIPRFMESHFTALRKALEDGALNPRNQRSGHGQGAKIIPVPEYMAAYTLHLAGSNILLLARANEEIADNIPF